MRHHLVHEYYQVSKASIWDTLTNDIAELRPFIVKYIDELSQNQEINTKEEQNRKYRNSNILTYSIDYYFAFRKRKSLRN